jgi:RimJ/RimL family protein N-acetyltransferase
VSIEIETERLLLRMPRPDDADAVAEMLGDPEVMRFLGGQTVPREEVPATIHRWLTRWNENGFGPFMLERRADGRVVGRVGALAWDTRTWSTVPLADAGEHLQVELGWGLARAEWGHGYAFEGAVAVREWLRGQGFSDLISLIDPDNVASARLAERLGATPGATVTLFDGGPAVIWSHPQ